MRTEELIHQLTGDAEPVRPLATPWHRAAGWFAISAAYAAAISFVLPSSFEGWQGNNVRYWIEQIATLLTAATAVGAAFASTVPGYDRRWLLLPLAPLAVWMATLGESCVGEWFKYGDAALHVHTDWDCLTIAALMGIVPAIAVVAMLKRGAPLVPNATLALGALAVAAFSNFAVRLHHGGDANLIIVFWHFGLVVVLASAASLVGRFVLKWPRNPFK